jgi:hypothetical protein
MQKFGSDQQQLANSGGSVISQDNAVLINGDSQGESALLFGPAALREIQAGVANGSFAIPPSDAEATITADNALPYWTFTDVNSAGAITAALVSDTGAGSGYVLRFTVASGTLTGKSATLTRFIPVASSASRSFSFYAEATFESGTASTQSTAKVSGQFYKSDQTTTTGSPITSNSYPFSSLVSATGITAPDLYAVAPDLTTMTAPADAAFLKLTITIATVATQSAARTVDLTEVRLAYGLPELLLTDKDDPVTYPPALITEQMGVLSLVSGTQDTIYVGPIVGAVASSMISLTSGGSVDIEGATTVDLTAPSGINVYSTGTTLGTLNANIIDANTVRADNTTTSDLLLQATGSDLIFQDTNAANGTNPRILLRAGDGTYYAGVKSGAAGVVQILSGSSATTYGQVWADRIYPMNGSTASRYIFDNGSVTAFSGGVLAGAITSTGTVSANNFTADTITGTTATTNAAIWVNTAGTTYNLRRNTSSARYKTNIVDADAAVLEAAKKVKPRHYESTIADEAGATRLGFIAEEVEAAGLTHAVGYNAEGQVETLDPTALIAALFARVNDLEERLKTLEGA